MSGSTGSKNKSSGSYCLAMFDLTVKARADYELQHKQILEFMRNNGKKWCFQLEQGEETGYLHFQCRISLSIKKRLETMIKLCKETPAFKEGFKVSPTSNPCTFGGDMFYVSKEETRVDGPWSSKNDINTNKITPYLRATPDWYPWQKSVIAMLEEEPVPGKVKLILNPKGNVGKTTLVYWLYVRKMVVKVPPLAEAKDIMRMVMAKEESRAYIIDLPCQLSDKLTKQFGHALESISNGEAYDDRYEWRDRIGERPHVFVFSNAKLNEKMLTARRWEFYTITERLELIRIHNQDAAFDTFIPPPPQQPILNILPHPMEQPIYNGVIYTPTTIPLVQNTNYQQQQQIGIPNQVYTIEQQRLAIILQMQRIEQQYKELQQQLNQLQTSTAVQQNK
jgi:hypothetical protein